MKKMVRPFDRLPWGYGVSYLCPDMDVAVCYPIPINLIVSAARYVWITMRHGFVPVHDRFKKEMQSMRSQMDWWTNTMKVTEKSYDERIERLTWVEIKFNRMVNEYENERAKTSDETSLEDRIKTVYGDELD